MDGIALEYVRLVLALGKHDDGYVDAYYGPEEWKPAASEPLPALVAKAQQLLSDIQQAHAADGDALEAARRVFLQKQIIAVKAHASSLATGTKLSFDEEASVLYDAHPPHKSDGELRALLAALEQRLPVYAPGQSLADRYGEWKKQFVIPTEKLDAVFQCALGEAKRQTLARIPLPEGERFVVEYVREKPWSGYNWYKGGFFSVIQVNTDLPIYIDRAFDLAAHEGYPGHHVFNSLLEEHLYRRRGWKEFCVYPLFSPQSLIAEGTANFGIEMVFPTLDERVAFEEEHLFPLAGISPTLAREYYEIESTMRGLDYVSNEAARRLVDGVYTRDQTIDFLASFLSSRERATKRVSFFEAYRSYVINYNVGLDMVRTHVDQRVRAATGASPATKTTHATGDEEGDNHTARWHEFTALLTSPCVPSMLTGSG
jgi:hypothetical protein